MPHMAARIRIRVLIVDDEDAVCRRLRGWLEPRLFEVSTFGRGDDAIAYAARVPHEVALIDLRMADQDGVQVIRDMREASPATRVIAMTAFPEVPQVLAAVRAGAADLLDKPVQEPALVRALETQLALAGVVARDETDFNRRLGHRVRAVRQAAERTLEQVAEASDLSAAQLSQIELGKTATTTWTLARICGALHVPLDRLFRDL
jgi:DNA-binding NtrC family response regulator